MYEGPSTAREANLFTTNLGKGNVFIDAWFTLGVQSLQTKSDVSMYLHTEQGSEITWSQVTHVAMHGKTKWGLLCDLIYSFLHLLLTAVLSYSGSRRPPERIPAVDLIYLLWIIAIFKDVLYKINLSSSSLSYAVLLIHEVHITEILLLPTKWRTTI